MDQSGTGPARPEPARRKAFYASPEKAAPDFITGVVLFLLSLYVLVTSYRMPHFAGSGWLGSPGLTPGLIALVLLLLSLALMFRARDFRLRLGPLQPRIEGLRAGACFAMIFVYILVTPLIGYVPATFALLFVFQTAYARKLSVRYVLIWSIGLSALLTFILWYVFGEIFFVPLP
jgi:hypothetical protein